MSWTRHARTPEPCPDCGTTIRPSSLARHRLSLTCAIDARTWALAARGFHAYARQGLCLDELEGRRRGSG
jgi:hypothetical protein